MATGSLESFGRNPVAQERTNTPTLQRRAMEEFLGISVDEELTHYRLLGISENITNPTAIERAAESRMVGLRQYTNNKQYGIVIQELLNMISRAKITLLDAEAKPNYDAMLATRRKAEETLRQRAEPAAPPIEPAVIRQSPTIAPAQGPTFVETLQQQWKVAAGAAVILAGTGVVWFATAGGEKEGAPVAAAKAPKEPESDKPTVTKVIATDTQSKMNMTFTPPAVPETRVETTVIAPQNVPTSSAFLAVEPEKIPLQEQPVAKPAPRLEKPKETLVAGATPPAEKTFDKKEYADNRQALLAAVKDKKGTEQIDEIITTYADNAELMKDPEMAKAVLVEGFILATKAGDAQRSYNLGRRMFDRPDLFEKSEMDYASGKLKELAVASNDRMVAFSIFELLVSKGALSNADALSLKLTHYKRGPKKTPEMQQATAREMLTIARGWTDAEPSIAEQFARDAKVMFPASRETKKLKDDFDDEVAAALKSIMQSKEFKKANELLTMDPTNQEALRVRGEIHMERGNVKEGLADLAKSNHATLALLARETEELQSKGAAASGTALLAAADRWKDEAVRANGKAPAFNSIEISLLRLASTATVDPLHPLTKPQVIKRLKDFATIPAVQVSQRPAPGPKAVSPEKQEWVSGLPYIKKSSAVRGSWKIDERSHEITSSNNVTFNPGLQFPWKVKSEEFDATLEVTFERTRGEADVHLYLPTGGGVVLTLCGWPEKGYLSGVSTVKGTFGDKNESARQGKILEGIGRHVIEVDVTQERGITHIVVRTKGKMIYEFQCKTADLAQHKDWSMPKDSFGFGVGGSDIALRDVRLLKKKGEIELDSAN